MLQSLEILNGELTPVFNKYTDIYSVNITSDIDSLAINYIVDEGYSVNVVNNSNFVEGENTVYIYVSNEKEQNTYTLLVNKERTEVTNTFDYNLETIEVVKELPKYVAPLIGISCFLIILFVYTLLFHKKKHK